MEIENIGKLIMDKFAEIHKKQGQIKLMVVGSTGVGKSTLVNAVFRERLAATGDGKPVTKGIKEITKKDFPLTLVDSEGLEKKDYNRIKEEIATYVNQCINDCDSSNHIHCVWLCISGPGKRIEEGEKEILNLFYEKGIPIIVVITQCATGDNDAFVSVVRKELTNARMCIPVQAEPVKTSYVTIPQIGLDDLLSCTYELVPDGKKLALLNAAKAGLDLKMKNAKMIIAANCTAAAATGAIPIPIADAAVLVPIQITMLAEISLAFGLDLGDGFIGTLVSGSITGILGSFGGRTIVSSLLKLIPGAGTLVGGVISATTASTITGIFGTAYANTLYAILKDSPDIKTVTPELLSVEFKKNLKNSNNS